MKTIICAFILLSAFSASAREQSNSRSECLDEGIAFQAVAAYRDAGLPPEYAFNAQLAQSSLSRSFSKNIVNLVYFDPRFINAGGEALMTQVMESCLYPNGRYRPL